MPFGLCNAPTTFHRLMNAIFEKEIKSFILGIFGRHFDL